MYFMDEQLLASQEGICSTGFYVGIKLGFLIAWDVHELKVFRNETLDYKWVNRGWTMHNDKH